MVATETSSLVYTLPDEPSSVKSGDGLAILCLNRLVQLHLWQLSLNRKNAKISKEVVDNYDSSDQSDVTSKRLVVMRKLQNPKDHIENRR